MKYCISKFYSERGCTARKCFKCDIISIKVNLVLNPLSSLIQGRLFVNDLQLFCAGKDIRFVRGRPSYLLTEWKSVVKKIVLRLSLNKPLVCIFANFICCMLIRRFISIVILLPLLIPASIWLFTIWLFDSKLHLTINILYRLEFHIFEKNPNCI